MISPRLVLICLLAWAPVLFPVAFREAGAQEGATPGNADARRLELERVRQDIRQLSRQQQRLARERAALAGELRDISARLVALARRVRELRAGVARDEARIATLRREQGAIRARLAANHHDTVRLVAVLQRLQQDPPPPFVTSASDVLAAVRGAVMLGQVVPRLDARARALRRDLSRLERLREGLERERRRRRENLARLNDTSARMEGLLRLKRDLLSRTDAELARERRRLAALHAQARTLRELLDALDKAPPAPPATRPPVPGEREDREREEGNKDALAAPPPPITTLKGRLPWPARGRLLARYGQRTDLHGAARGVYLATPPGALVTAPAAGVVRTAGPYRTYGHIVYLDVGQGYRILLAGMARTVVGKGEKVRAGEPLGMMGERAMPATVPLARAAHDGPVLYMEFRKRKRPLDPEPWWLGGHKQARRK